MSYVLLKCKKLVKDLNLVIKKNVKYICTKQLTGNGMGMIVQPLLNWDHVHGFLLNKIFTLFSNGNSH